MSDGIMFASTPDHPFTILNGTPNDYRAAMEMAQAQHEQGLLPDNQFDEIYKVCLDAISNGEEEEMEAKHAAPDMVNHPPHYRSMDGSGIECIDAIRASMTREMFLGYLKGNAEKYLWRAGQKEDATEDLEKMEWYSNRYKQELGEE